MAKQGLHLQNVNLFCLYTFVQGEPADVSYRLDFVLPLNRNGEYFALIQEAGSEHVKEITGWLYWRKSIVNGKVPEIFSDASSKTLKFKRALWFLALGISPLLVAVIISYLGHASNVFEGEPVAVAVLAAIVLFYLFGFINIYLRIRALNRGAR